MKNKKETRLQNVMTEAHNNHTQGLNARAFFKVNNHEIGEDLVQDTFMKAWKYLVKGGKIEIMKAFLYHILNQLITDQYRKRKMTSLDILLEKGFDLKGEDSEHTYKMLDGKRALGLINSLPEKFKKIIHMKYIQDLTLREMSDATGQSKSTLAVQLHRGIEKLRILYGKE